MSSSRVYVGGLRPDITERELEEEVRVVERDDWATAQQQTLACLIAPLDR
jgi:hypothetical protein